MTVSAIALCLAAGCAAGEKGNEGDGVRPPKPELGPDGLPKYHHPYTDGLYSTVTTMNLIGVPEIENYRKSKVRPAGFKKDVPVHYVLRETKAPLVVVLQGVDGKVDGPYGPLFPYWYSANGFNVLTFDSTFTPAYPANCGQGVVGNFDAEADQIAAIIDAFLKTPEAQKSVTRIGVVGMSFGATQALVLAAKAKAGKLPFELSGCLALSPPLKLRTAAQVVDRFFAEDRWDTTMIKLAEKFCPHVPVAEGQAIPFKPTELRAAIGFAFRDGLTQVVERNDRAYKLKILPSEESGEHRGTWAEATGFVKFIEEFTFPYWQKKGAVKTPQDLWDMTDLSKILPRLPDFADAVVAANDPFNTADDLAEVRAADVNKRLIVVPNGGHLGMLYADWTLEKCLCLFKERRREPALQQSDLDRARKELRDTAKDASEKK